MNASTENAASAAPAATNAQTTQTAKETESCIVRRIFQPESLATTGTAAVAAMLAEAEKRELGVRFTFNQAEDFPADTLLATIPLNKRAEKQGDPNVMTGLVVAALPTYEAMAAAEGGAAWCKGIVEASMLATVANATRPRKDGGVANSVPTTVQDFLASGNADSDAQAWRAMNKSYCERLRKMGLASLTVAQFRKCLASSAYAEQAFRKMNSQAWDIVLGKMVARAEELGLPPGLLGYWQRTRSTVAVSEESFDLSALESLDADGDDENGNADDGTNG